MRQAPIRGMVSLGLLALLSTGGAASSPEPSARRSRQVRTLHLRSLEGRKPAGVGYSASAGLFYVTTVPAGDARRAAGPSVIAMTFDEEAAGHIELPSAPGDPINVTYDARFERLLWLDAAGNRLLAIALGNGGLPDAARAAWLQIPAGLALGPRGLAADPETGTLFILDSVARRLVRIETDVAGRPRPARTSFIPLSGVEGTNLTGLAIEPGTGHLYLLNPTLRLLYEVTQSGRAVAAYDVARSGLKKPAAMGFAPSGDLTDDPAALSLYVADQGGTSAQSLGSVTEISLAEPEQVTSPVALVSSSLVRTIATSSWSPPSPDPSGITYDSSRNRLLVTDGEVEEMSIWNNRNYFECSLTGSILDGANLISFSDEPVGVAFDPRNGHVFFSDDDARRIFEVDKGPDGRLRTSDDILTSFSTTAFGSGDPEGVTVDYVGNRLFIADGVNAEIYVLRPGSNGRFEGGVDDTITHFDTAGLGVVDPETVEFNALRSTLYTIGHDGTLVEITTTGGLVREIDTSFINLDHPSGLAHAPGSSNSSARNLYISDRHADNDSNPNENDGRIYEITTGDTVSGNQSPSVSAGPNLTITLPATASLNGTVSDDGLPSGTLTTTWSKVSGPGTVTFGNAGAVDTTATLSAPGTYVLRLTANDGAATTSDDAQIIANGTGGGGGTNDYRISASSDDAEEDTLGGIDLVSSDIELVFDGTDQTVGLRFTGINVPRGASVTSAYLQFKVDEANIGPAPLLIRGQAADNAPTFTSAAGNISSRPKTTAAVSWSPPDWTTVGAAGTGQRSPDLSDVIEAITGRAGWSAGNSLVLIITGTGERTAESFEGDAAGAALLHIEVAATGPGNQAPIVNAGPDQAITLPAGASLNGTVTDDGLPSPTVTTTWTKASGPGSVGFGNAGAVDTTATFSTSGVYVLSLTASDGVASASDDVQITVNSSGGGSNIAPNVSAGADQTVILPAGASLNGTVTDDGLPSGTLTTTWTKTSGPGIVSFVSSISVDTTATFSAPGIYVLRLTASDGAAASSDEVQIIANQAPSVSAGPDQVLALPTTVSLDGSAVDDGLPSGTLATTWTKVSGPGSVSFGNAGSVDTTASFSAPGVYVLRLTASDGTASTTDDVRIYVRDPVTGFIPVDVRVGTSSDDAEQRSQGQVSLSSGDLQLVVYNDVPQQVGIRFASVPILPGATIRSAYVQFKADEVQTGSTALVIQAQAADNAPTFISSKNNISSRTKTSASASWSPAGWTTVGAAGAAQRTPELAAVIQQVVNRPGWSSGNALVVIITGSGRRTAESVEGDAAGAPLLHVEFQ